MDNLPNGSSNSSFDPARLDPNPVHHIPLPPKPQVSSSSSSEPSSPNIHITHTQKEAGKDPPLVDLKVTNPLTYLKNWLTRLLKNQDIDIRIKIKPFATLALIGAFSAVFGLGYGFGLNSAAKALFPNSSPLLKRAITVEGTIQKSSSGKYYLSANNTLWTLNALSPVSEKSLNSLVGKDASIKGNLTAEKNLINVSEVISLDAPEPAVSQAEPPPVPATPSSPASSVSLPGLYANIQWEKNEKKVLLFTSGKRRIEQEGIYLESVLVKEYPQEFINYYINELSGLGFKQTLNSTDTNGTTITYAKDNAFFTFGIKYSYSGSGEKKNLTGYKAFLEHN